MSESNGNGNGTKNAIENASLAPPGRGGTRLRFGPGIGGKKGRSGRPPDEFKAALAAIADEAVRLGYVTKILHNHKHPLFMRALEFATDRGYGAIASQHELKGDIAIRVIREPRASVADD